MKFLGITVDKDGIVALLFLGALLLMLLREAWRAWRFVRASVQTRGEVIGYPSRQVEASNEDGTYMRTVYSQLIRYTDRDGVVRTFNGPSTGSRKRNTIGTSIAIRYHPQQALSPRVDSVMSLYGRLIWLLGMVVVVLMITLNTLNAA